MADCARLLWWPLLQFLYCGKKATLAIGNIKPLGELPEGTIVCNVEEVSQVSCIMHDHESDANGLKRLALGRAVVLQSRPTL